MDVYSKCSNYASDTCPCVLAENNACIICSMCRGEEYCTCTDTVSYCILQELKNNGGRSKSQYESILCEVVFVKEYGDGLCFVRIRVPDADKYKRLGSYVLIRTKEDPFFDVPISVLYEEYVEDTFSGGSFFEIMEEEGLYSTDISDIKKRVENENMWNLFSQAL